MQRARVEVALFHTLRFVVSPPEPKRETCARIALFELLQTEMQNLFLGPNGRRLFLRIGLCVQQKNLHFLALGALVRFPARCPRRTHARAVPTSVFANSTLTRAAVALVFLCGSAKGERVKGRGRQRKTREGEASPRSGGACIPPRLPLLNSFELF